MASPCGSGGCCGASPAGRPWACSVAAFAFCILHIIQVRVCVPRGR